MAVLCYILYIYTYFYSCLYLLVHTYMCTLLTYSHSLTHSLTRPRVTCVYPYHACCSYQPIHVVIALDLRDVTNKLHVTTTSVSVTA